MKVYYVKYKVPSMNTNILTQGPYKSPQEAKEHERDIAGYEGVVSMGIDEVEVEEDLT